MNSSGRLTDLSDENLAATVDLNGGEWARLQGRLPWVKLHDAADVLWVCAKEPWPRNCVVLARFPQAGAKERVAQVLAQHLRHKPGCQWIVGPLSTPADLERHLRHIGFRCKSHCAGMACDLSKLPTASLPDDVQIRLMEESPALYPLTSERRRLRQEGRTHMARLQPRQVWHFAALRDGQCIGETTLCAGAGVAGIYDVEVLKEFRGRGIGAALMLAALRHGKKLEYRAAVLGASGLGRRVYARLGFRQVCKISFWRYA